MRSHQQVAGSTCQFGGQDRGENSRVARSQPPNQIGCEHFLINHKAANRFSSPCAPLPRPTPTPEGGGGRNKAKVPPRDPEPRSRSRVEGLWAEAAPGSGRREATGLPLLNPAHSLRRLFTTAEARIPAPGLSFLRSKFTLFWVRPPLLKVRGNSAAGGHRGAPIVPCALSPHASCSTQTLGLGLASQHRVEREGRAGQGSCLSPPLLYLPPLAAIGRRGPWAEPWWSAGPAARRLSGSPPLVAEGGRAGV